MSLTRNSILIAGNLGNNPQVTTFENGTKLARFSIASNDLIKRKNGEVEKTTAWHRVVAWGHFATHMEDYGTKGKHMMLQGKVVNRNYTSKTGENRSVTEIEIIRIVSL